MTGRRLALGAFFCAVVVFLYAPIGVVVANSFNANELLTSWEGFTLDWYSQALESSRVRAAFRTSLVIAVIATVLSVAIAVAGGLWARGASARKGRVFDATTYMRIVLPEVVAALGLFVLFGRLEIALGAATIIIGHVVLNSAYATVIIQARLATLTPVLEEAASDLGARPWRVFRRVTVPLLAPAMVVAGLLVFTFSFDNVVLSDFLGGTESETLPVLLFGQARFRVSPELNAIGSGVMLVTLLGFLLALAVAGSARMAGETFVGRRNRAGGGQG
jgi:ABC-type spermidine/putrescine transport system permease subunit II